MPKSNDRVIQAIEKLSAPEAKKFMLRIVDILYLEVPAPKSKPVWNLSKEWDSEHLDYIIEAIPENVMAEIKKASR